MRIARILAPMGVLVLVALAFIAYTNTSQPKTVSSAGSKAPTSAVDSRPKPNVVYTVTADALLREDYATIAELNKSDVVDAVVKGRVTATEDVYAEGIANRVLTVEVGKRFKGSTTATVRVYEDGGYVKLKDMLPDIAAHLDPSAFTDDQIENGVVDVIFMGAPHSEVGDNVILYLKKNPNASQADSYQLVSAMHGRFILNSKSGDYERSAGIEAAPGFQKRIPARELEAALSDAR